VPCISLFISSKPSGFSVDSVTVYSLLIVKKIILFPENSQQKWQGAAVAEKLILIRQGQTLADFLCLGQVATLLSG
jgi:hypothetical protein